MTSGGYGASSSENGRKLAKEAGYEIREVPYKNFPPRIRGSEQKMRQALETAADQAETILTDLDFSAYDRILFIARVSVLPWPSTMQQSTV